MFFKFLHLKWSKRGTLRTEILERKIIGSSGLSQSVWYLVINADSIRTDSFLCFLLQAEIPKDKPRLLPGLWNPRDIIQAVRMGVDIFDSSYPFLLQIWASEMMNHIHQRMMEGCSDAYSRFLHCLYILNSSSTNLYKQWSDYEVNGEYRQWIISNFQCLTTNATWEIYVVMTAVCSDNIWTK